MGLTFLLPQLSEGGGGSVDSTHTHYTTGTGTSIIANPGAPRVASASPGAGGGGLNNNNQGCHKSVGLYNCFVHLSSVRKARPEAPRCFRWATVSPSGPTAVD